MALSFVATQAFERDYDAALAYLTYELASPRAAVSLMNAMEKSVEKICANPCIDHVSTKPSLARLEYREELVGNYVMLYKIEDEAIVAKRLFHGSQDYENYL